MNVDTISDFLAEQRDEAPEELQALVLDFENYWERKLWHQLTDALVKFFSDPGSAPQRLAFFKVFVSKFADKINQLKLVDLALKAVTQCRGRNRHPQPLSCKIHSQVCGHGNRTCS
jgi:26S proteasome regulatory subunit N9